MSVLKTERAYSELGKLLDIIARKRDVRGPYRIAQEMNLKTGSKITGQSVSKTFYGAHPRQKFIRDFTETFALTVEERSALAWTYAYKLTELEEKEA